MDVGPSEGPARAFPRSSFTRRAASRRVFRHARDVLSGVGLRAGRARRALARATARKRPSRCRRGCPRARRREPPSAPSTPRPSRVRGGCGSRRASPLDIAIVGAGFAGVATAWHVVHLLATDGDGDAAPTASAVDPAVPAVPRRPVRLRLFDEKGIAGGASGVAAGLLHPYTPRGKIIWRGVESVAATLRLVDAAEAAERALDAGHAHLPPIPPPPPRERGRAIAWRKEPFVPRETRNKPATSRATPRGGELADEASVWTRTHFVDSSPEYAYPPRWNAETTPTTRRHRRHRESVHFKKWRSIRAPGTRARGRRGAPRAPRAAALHVPEGLVLDSSRYLAALWDATRLLASSDAVPAGTSATFHVRTVTALDDDPELASCDAVVVACGAAAESVSELAAAGLPTALQGGHVVELTRPTGEAPDPSVWDDGRPGILGSPYVAPLGPERLLVGTTREYDATVATARRAGARDPKSDAVAAAAAEKLTRDVVEVYPPLRSMSVDAVRYGVRANPPRRALGSLPLVGRVRVGEETETETDGDGDGTRATRRTRWYVGGLGARGLVYHGMVGEMVARAALTGDGGGSRVS